MSPFCENKLCRLQSVDAPGQVESCSYVEVNGNTVTARRVLLADKARNKAWVLCEICAHAVAVVNER
jgi:hypothetical protein